LCRTWDEGAAANTPKVLAITAPCPTRSARTRAQRARSTRPRGGAVRRGRRGPGGATLTLDLQTSGADAVAFSAQELVQLQAADCWPPGSFLAAMGNPCSEAAT